MTHGSRPPDVPALLRLLEQHHVRFILAGSVAAAAYGVEVEPGDLDIVPESSEGNLRKLVDALEEMEARPLGPFGAWTTLPTGEKKWVPRETSDRELADWKPDIEDTSSLDHLYVTRFGNFDVVPELVGTYDHLKERAALRTLHGFELQVAHVDDLLARLTIPRREKDRNRVAALRRVQRGDQPC